MRFIIYGLVGLGAFLTFMVMILFFTGNLNGEAVNRLLSKEPDLEAQTPAIETSELGPLAQSIKKKEANLKQKEAALQDREKKLNSREQELDQLRIRLEKLQEEIEGALMDADKKDEMRLETIAITLENMKATNAAQRLEGYPIEDAAKILIKVKDKERGKIIESMEPSMATKVLREMQKSTF